MSDSISFLDIFTGMFMFLKPYWWLFLIAFTPSLLRWIGRVWKHQKIARAGFDQIDSMNGEAFEIYLQSLFSKMGYHVRRTPYRGDFGADLILTKDGKTIAVQAKRASNRVGVKAVQEITAARAHYQCDSALVVTNNNFTQQAQKLARSNKVELWNREQLATAINAHQSTVQVQKA